MEDSSSTYLESFSPYELLFRALLMIPTSHYIIGLTIIVAVYLYNVLECHIVGDILAGNIGQPVTLTFNSKSKIYEEVVSKCRVLHGRYKVTPWLASPHFQTSFLHFFGRPPVFSYKREIFRTSDGGTLGLDWLMSSDVKGGAVELDDVSPKHDRTPIVVVIPGLSSDSNHAYVKHLAYNTAKSGRNVVVCNHRGLGGVPITSDCFYNAGWTEDLRVIVRHLHGVHPDAPLFVVGTSIGANVLIKYLGEEGEDTPIAGAIAIGCPWDLLAGERFLARKPIQKLYDKSLTIDLQSYAKLHEPRFSRFVNWEAIEKARSIRDFDDHATRIVAKYETVDTYYRKSSSSSYVVDVAIPLLCISALDDPVCTREAIPWDECRVNKNIILATTEHGGHLAFFEGITGSSLWWVRAVNEFIGILHSSPYMHRQKKVPSPEFSTDQGSQVNEPEKDSCHGQ